jgi:hypothetical protein
MSILYWWSQLRVSSASAVAMAAAAIVSGAPVTHLRQWPACITFPASLSTPSSLCGKERARIGPYVWPRLQLTTQVTQIAIRPLTGMPEQSSLLSHACKHHTSRRKQNYSSHTDLVARSKANPFTLTVSHCVKTRGLQFGGENVTRRHIRHTSMALPTGMELAETLRGG